MSSAVRVRTLREAKGWSQADLAEAACLNIRTVQRIESGAPFAAETLLSVAGALNEDVSTLVPPAGGAPPCPHERSMKGLGSREILLAAFLSLPCISFVTLNILKFGLRVDDPYDVLASIGSALVSFRTFNALSPYVFIGGLAGALLVCARGLLRFEFRSRGRVVWLDGLRVRIDPVPMLIVAGSLLCGFALLAYAASEYLHSLAS